MALQGPFFISRESQMEEMIFVMEEYEYNRAINALISHVKELSLELSSVLCDICRYLPEDSADAIRKMTAEDINYRLFMNVDYRMYVECEFEGIDELTEEDYLDDVSGYLNDEDDSLFLPSYYSRKELQR